ncbi:polysaccharide biosynthesis/export family protein [Mucilaginibacter glaciei]|uniref:Polysaccharide biosynthesis/export family protein n=1 Tax=Mucilaginibacter glaciei TaxID=2772109 RepID=A0A926NRF4_9SPHI|nr:polysaccharide biosynthesis/export family protein [Mucilaginibacter glaciei]MBD1394651.1 polysaccharide biosynthesis/export family protein [Mucilaginibacter glaciei]
MLKYSRILICTLISAVALCSCGSYKNIPYYQDLNRTGSTDTEVQNYVPLTIQRADILGINVSSKSPESSVLFNYRVNGNSGDNAPDNPITGFLVDENGEVHLPLVGDMKVLGLTTSQFRKQLNDKMLTFYKEAVVSVRVLNFRVAVSGDVQRPGIYNVQNERITVTQALTLAGDLNITAIRNIVLIREQDGKRKFIPLDLTSKKIFDSPYYYLRNNDEIYVQPDRTKYATVDRGYRTATLILSGLSIIAIVLSNLYR